ncbi:MAG: methylated-DNA--[protein]-cysteine S-methyltransferase [Planctomycetes bacterium]|nr:methylated-DNA--[protein]-cysteine S-methyltransferase [Planctomycetota bacterium]
MHADYERVAAAIRWLELHRAERPSLEDLSRALGSSPFHLQRTFQRWAGISPKRFLQLLALGDAKRALARGASVLDAADHAGLSAPSRLHDAFVALEAMSPAEWRAGGAGLALRWGIGRSPFGDFAAAWSERGISALTFGADDGSIESAAAALRASWPGARWSRGEEGIRACEERLAGGAAGEPLRLHVRGTSFQVQVWRALLALPSGAACSYAELARAVGVPNAARAVGTAVGANGVAVLIPCHRVLRATGALGGYRWGPDRKRALVAWEAAREERDAEARTR